MREGKYNREKAVQYAHKWAFSRNPAYYNFEKIGGNCTNFVSQCLYAGTKTMNFSKNFGWYYINQNKRAPAWTSTISIYDFLTKNDSVGPFGYKIDMEQVQIGDLVQLKIDKNYYHHTPIIVSVGINPSLENILVAANSYDSDNRPLSTYKIQGIRFIHIDGYRDWK